MTFQDIGMCAVDISDSTLDGAWFPGETGSTCTDLLLAVPSRFSAMDMFNRSSLVGAHFGDPALLSDDPASGRDAPGIHLPGPGPAREIRGDRLHLRRLVGCHVLGPSRLHRFHLHQRQRGRQRRLLLLGADPVPSSAGPGSQPQTAENGPGGVARSAHRYLMASRRVTDDIRPSWASTQGRAVSGRRFATSRVTQPMALRTKNSRSSISASA